ncbi:hypothetical protein [Pararhizobium sp. A13]|uniref:hypothetical protein n=1 Tax=Pararhizobium sp. A13 TaxID=3133975 RepID=UPI00325089D1
MSLRSLDNAIFVSQRVPIPEFYGRSYADEHAELRPVSIIHDELSFTLEPRKPVMTEVTANTTAVPSADIHVRPPLPEGIRYMFDDCDRVTITDVSGAPEGAFHPDHESYMGYLYRNSPTYGFDAGAGTYDLASSVRRDQTASVVHFIRHPTARDYGKSPAFEGHPGNFALYPYNSGNPWRDCDWWKNNYLRWVEHMPAPSVKHPGLLMYFQSPEKRARDIRTPIKPGKYLTKFFSDVLTGEEINNFAVMWSNMATPPKLSVTMDADEIEQLYKGKHNGSCMHFANDGYSGDQHPARAYAGPDLAQAYIGDLDCADARCLVWPEKMIYYPKFYGDYRRLESALEVAGYKRASEDAFIGARIQRLPYKGTFVAPYLDVGGSLKDDGEYLSISDDGGYPCRETDGLAVAGKRCTYTGGRFSEDEMTHVSDYGWVNDESLHNSGSFFECAVTDEWYHVGNRARSPSDYPVSNYAVRNLRNLVFYCDATDMYYLNSEYSYVQMANGDYWEADHFASCGSTCDLSGECYPDDEVTYLDNGKCVADCLIDEEDEAYRAFAGLDTSDNEDTDENVEVEAA